MPLTSPRLISLTGTMLLSALLSLPVRAETEETQVFTRPDDALVVPESPAAATGALVLEGYTLVTEGGRPESTTIRIERQGETLVKRTGLGFGLIGPTDVTGNGLTNFLLMVAPDFMAEVELTLLELGPAGLVEIDMSDTQRDSLRERLEIGHLLQFVIPADSAVRDWYRDPMDELALEAVEDDSAYPDMTERMAALGYGLLRDEGSLRILRHGVEVWGEQSWMLSVEGPRDFTGDNLPQLLVHAARGRSFRAVTLLQLGAAEVSALWSVEGHVTEMRAVDEELARQMAQGEPLVLPSVAARPGGIRTMDGVFPDPD